jgi:isocitrate dehydrogenase kinase/phosphatase
MTHGRDKAVENMNSYQGLLEYAQEVLASTRAQLAARTQEWDASIQTDRARMNLYSEKITECLMLQQQLTASEQKVKVLEEEVAKAANIIIGMMPLAPITEADIQWAQHALGQGPTSAQS